MSKKKTKSKPVTPEKPKARAELSSSDLLGHGHTFELVGAITTVNQEFKFGTGEQWIDFHAGGTQLNYGAQYRRVEGLPVPPTALPFIKPGQRLKITVTIVP